MQLVGEWLTGQPSVSIGNLASPAWGVLQEQGAMLAYEEKMGKVVIDAGFITHPVNAMIGCSPDGLVGDTGGVEVKCPHTTKEHVRAIFDPESFVKSHIHQVQGCMWVTGREWWDLCSFDPRCHKDSLVVVRIPRSEEWVRTNGAKIERFAERLESVLQEHGYSELKFDEDDDER